MGENKKERHDNFITNNREQQEAYYAKFAVVSTYPHLCFRVDWNEDGTVEELLTIQAETSEDMMMMALVAFSERLIKHIAERRKRKEEE